MASLMSDWNPNEETVLEDHLITAAYPLVWEFIMWASDCCLWPNEQFFSYIMTRTSYILMTW